MSIKRLHSDERGGILVLSAFMVAVFLVLDGARRRRRQLVHAQAPTSEQGGLGALAAGYEYLAQLENCRTSPVATATAISDVAKRYAGTGDAARSGTSTTRRSTHEQPHRPHQCVEPDRFGLDGRGESVRQAYDGRLVQPGNAIWTDVKVQETNVGTLFGGFGLNLLSATAQARVELKQIVGVRRGGLPFVNETGDHIDCVWAEFVPRGRRAPGLLIGSLQSRAADGRTRTPATGGRRTSEASTSERHET